MVTVVEEIVMNEPRAGSDATETFLAVVRLRVQRQLLWMRATLGEPEDSRAWMITEAEVERLLEDPAEQAAREEAFYQVDLGASQLGKQIEAVERELLLLPQWNRLRNLFGLTDFEANLLTLAMAVAFDPRLARVFAYLADDVNAGHATPSLVGILFQMRTELIDAESALWVWRLATPAGQGAGVGDGYSAHTGWVADASLLPWFEGRPVGASSVGGCALEFFDRRDLEGMVCLYPQVLTRVAEFVRSVQEPSLESRSVVAGVLEIEFAGKHGSGKRVLAAQCAAELGLSMIAADAGSLIHGSASAQVADVAVRVKRLGLLTGAAIYWSRSEAGFLDVWESLPVVAGCTFYGTRVATAVADRTPAPRRSFSLPQLTRELRVALWQRLSGYPVPAIVEEWILSPSEIATAAQVAPSGTNAIAEVCRDSLRGVSEELFVELPCRFTWDDIVLPAHTREHLAELEQQVKLRWQVYEEWGFQRLCTFGSGITAMFSGPSGTGKTMAAQVMANELKMQLYRVDLAGVMSKYIGETEKRLKQVFDACEKSNVLLFFDEADALFGQRMQSKDAHDRFANIEIDYLLQRMEQFDGVAILATNRANELDKAFVRRIRFMVSFQPPGVAERRALWRRALPERTPSGKQLLGAIEWDLLAQKLEMTGADIAAAAVNAAFLARAEGSCITMVHVMRAARREMAKHGNMLRAGDWEI